MKKRVAVLNYFDGPQTSPLDGRQTSPLNGPPTSPLNGPQTSPLNGPKTSPLNEPQTSPLNGPQTSPLNGPQTSPLNGLKPLLLEAIDTRSHFIRLFVSDKPWDGNVPWLPHPTPQPPPHTQTHPSTCNKTDHHNILNPTNCNQHLNIIIVILLRTFQVHVVLILLHCMPFVNI